MRRAAPELLFDECRAEQKDVVMRLGFVVMLLAGPLLMVLVAGVSFAAAVDRLGRNGTVGIRTSATLASDASWRAGHRAAVKPASWSAGLLIAADAIALLMARAGSSLVAPTVGLGVLFIGAIMWTVVASTRAARSTAALRD